MFLQKEMNSHLEEGRAFTSKLQKETNDKFLLEFKVFNNKMYQK